MKPAEMSTAGICMGHGVVRHMRLRPTRHAFAYSAYFLLIPMRRLKSEGASTLAVNRAGCLSFFDADHGDGRGPDAGGALAWMEDLLAAQNIHDAGGEIWLQTYPRVWGYSFKPVSFWYCHRADGSLSAIVAEVHNTFGQRHCYVLPQARYGHTMQAPKAFHVSPFCEVAGHYNFRFMRSGANGQERMVARIEYGDAQGPLIHTSMSGCLHPASAREIRKTFWRYPFFTAAVMLRIHWQALQLWLKRVPFWAQPAVPEFFVTRAIDKAAHHSTLTRP